MRMDRYKSGSHAESFWNSHERQSYKCPDCGRPESHPDVKRFEVHHKDENPDNGELSNLIGLCRHCHMARHGGQQRRSIEDWKMMAIEMGNDSINPSALYGVK